MKYDFEGKLIVHFKKLHPDAVVPQYAKAGDAGLDLVATDDGKDCELEGSVFREYGTGLAVEIPEGFVGLIFPRSSISKTPLALSNAVGVIDSGYRGEVRFRFRIDMASVALRLDAAEVHCYRRGDRIGQLVIMPYPRIAPVEAADLTDTARGTGGFGSSGR